MALLQIPSRTRESLLGNISEGSWEYFDTYFYLIRSARVAGPFYRYGFVFDIKGGVQNVRVDQLDGSLAYLDAFCTSAEWSPML